MHIEAIIEELARAERLPRKAVEAALSAPDEVVARTLDIIERGIRCEDLDDGTVSEEEQFVLVILLHVLGELGEPRLFEPLLRLLACDSKRVDNLVGDMLTESVHKILISTYGGDPQPLLALMGNRDADDYARDAAFRAWTYLAAKEVWPRETSKSYLARAFEELEPKKDSNIWVAWLSAVAILGFEEFVPMADEVFAAPRFCVDVFFGKTIVPLEREDFADDLRRGLEGKPEDGLLDEQDLRPVGDAISELSKWHCYSDNYHREQRRQRIAAVNVDTVTNEYRNVGRNDPCPCGSGKKFKKCCLA